MLILFTKKRKPFASTLFQMLSKKEKGLAGGLEKCPKYSCCKEYNHNLHTVGAQVEKSRGSENFSG